MIGKVVKLLTSRATEQLVHYFVTSRLDNCNPLHQTNSFIVYFNFFSIEQHDSSQWSHIPKKHDHITPVMRSLQWLPVRSRIIFKILLLLYKSLHGLAPAHLSRLIKPYSPESNLRPIMKNRLVEPRTRLVTFGDRAHCKADPTLSRCPSYHFKSYTELFQTKPENPSFYTRIFPYFKTFNKLLVCKAHWADQQTGTALCKNILFWLLLLTEISHF